MDTRSISTALTMKLIKLCSMIKFFFSIFPVKVLIHHVHNFSHLLPKHIELAQTDQHYWIRSMLKQLTSAECLSHVQS